MGTELCRYLLAETEATIRVYDSSEYNMHRLATRYGKNGRMRYLLGDVRDYDRLSRAMEDVDVVLHLAALKHVYLGQYNPMEVLKTNVLGTQNVIDCVLDEYDVGVMVYVSSDKAVNPSNFYGQSKAIGEGLTLNAEKVKGDRVTRFTVFRPGNFFLSAGNVIEKWLDQAATGSAVTVTRGNMRRYYIGIGRAAELLWSVAEKAEGGDIWVPRMEEYRMMDLAQLIGGDIEMIDPTPGEKEKEELWSETEAQHLTEHGDLYRIRF